MLEHKAIKSGGMHWINAGEIQSSKPACSSEDAVNSEVLQREQRLARTYSPIHSFMQPLMAIYTQCCNVYHEKGFAQSMGKKGNMNKHGACLQRASHAEISALHFNLPTPSYILSGLPNGSPTFVNLPSYF